MKSSVGFCLQREKALGFLGEVTLEGIESDTIEDQDQRPEQHQPLGRNGAIIAESGLSVETPNLE